MLNTECECGIKKWSVESCCSVLRIMYCFEPCMAQRKCMHVAGNNFRFLFLLRRKTMYVSSLSFSVDTEIDGLNLISSK